MADPRAWEHTVRQRLVLRDLLRSFTEEQWQRESLCAGWSVQDVAAHVISSPQLEQARLVWATLRARGDVGAVSFADAKRRSARGAARVLADFDTYLDNPGHFFAARRDDLLLDVVVHSQDILRPLSIRHAPPPEACALAAGRAVAHRRLFRTAPMLRAVRLVADDADWSAGQGPVVQGPVLELVMLCTGRQPEASLLSGDGTDLLRRGRRTSRSPSRPRRPP